MSFSFLFYSCVVAFFRSSISFSKNFYFVVLSYGVERREEGNLFRLLHIGGGVESTLSHKDDSTLAVQSSEFIAKHD